MFLFVWSASPPPCTASQSLVQRPFSLEADYWALAKCQAGWRVEFAFATADRDWSRFPAILFGCAAGADFVAYQDAAAGQQRFAHLADGRLAGALFLAPEPVVVSRDWAIEQLGADLVNQRARVAVVAGRPRRGLAERGATVCSCFGVGANQIAAAAKAGCVTVEAIGQALQAGADSGPCRAEIKGIINAVPTPGSRVIGRPYAYRTVLSVSFELKTPRSTGQSGPVGHPLLERLSSPFICTGAESAAGWGTVAKTIACSPLHHNGVKHAFLNASLASGRFEGVPPAARLWCELLGHSIVVGKSVERQS